MDFKNKLTAFLILLLLPAMALTDELTTLQTIMQGLRKNLVEIAAIGRFEEMIDGCFGCHIAYKDRIANVLRVSK